MSSYTYFSICVIIANMFYTIANNKIILILLIVLTIFLSICITSIIIRKIKDKKSIHRIEKGDIFLSNGKYQYALNCYLPQYDCYERKFGMLNINTVNIGMKIAKTYMYLYEFSLAQKYAYSLEDYHNSIQIEGNYREMIAYYTLLGNIKDGLEEYEKAMEYYDKALALCDSIGAEAAIDRAKCCWNKAIVLDRMGSFEDALANYTTAVRIFEDTDGDYRELIGRVYFNLGISLYLQKKYDVALVSLNKALNTSKTISKMHSTEAACYHFIGCIYHETNFPEKAIDSLLEALFIRLRTIGNQHPQYAETYNKIKQSYLEGNYPEEDFMKWIEDKLDNYVSSVK